MKKRAVLAVSGGMDSTGLLMKLLAEGYEIRAYSFDYGQKHKIEIERLRKNVDFLFSQGSNLKAWSIIDLKTVFNESRSALVPSIYAGITPEIPEGHYAEENMVSTVVENRNAIFSSIIFGKALAWANETGENVDICLGIHSGDHDVYPDCRPEFRDALEHAMKIGNYGSEKVNYYTPYLLGNKRTILLDTLDNCEKLGFDFDAILSNTNTCYNPDELGRSCGKCGSCVERVEAFLEIHLVDPVPYQENWEVIKANVISVLNK